MQIIELPALWTIIIDIAAWAVFHIGISYGMLKVPDRFFIEKGSWFKPVGWEDNGQVWQRWFRIQQWKRLLPDGTLFLKSGYDKSSLEGTGTETLRQFIVETRRGELTHWVSMLPAGLFFLWNPPWAGWIMVLYAVLFNLPFILAQRYNRPRLERVYKRKKKRSRAVEESQSR